ncbi:MAG: tetratricopeptide repeat protein [Methylovirgula sp.]
MSAATDHQDRLAAGLRLMDLGRFREAEDVFRYILRDAPWDPDALCGLAGAALAKGAKEEAFAVLVKARDVHPSHAGLLASLCAAHSAFGRFDEALVCIDAAIRMAPNDPGHRLAHVQVLMAQNRPIEAFEAVEASLAFASGHPDLLNAKGILLVRLGRKEAAAAAFQAAHAADPKRAEIAHNLAGALGDLGWHEEALGFAERAYLNEPGDPLYRNNLARCLASLGRLEEAKEAAKAALALSPQDMAATDMLASLQILSGAEDEGLALCANLVRQTHQSGEACLVLAQNLRLAGRFEQALSAIAPAKAQAATEAVARQLEFELQLCLGRYQQALGDQSIPAAAMKSFVIGGGTLHESIFCARWLQSDMRLHVPAELASLFAAFENAEVTSDPATEALPIGSLMVQGNSSPDLSEARPYLRLSDDAVKPWKEALRKLPGPYIGLLWDHAAPGLALTKLLPAITGAGTLIALAVDPLRHDLKDFPQIRDGGVNIGDAHQLAAAVAAMDLIIAPDSTVAHLAGALGKPGFVLVTAGHSWLWRAEDFRSVWYPSLEVIVQSRAGDWGEVLTTLAERLAVLIGRLAEQEVA